MPGGEDGRKWGSVTTCFGFASYYFEDRYLHEGAKENDECCKASNEDSPQAREKNSNKMVFPLHYAQKVK